MSLSFILIALIAVAGAAGVVLARPPVHSLLALVVTFFSLAALFLSLSAEFMALIQVIVYAGAIMVLFLFVIGLLTSRIEPVEVGRAKLPGQWIAGTVATVVMALVIVATATLAEGRPLAALGEGFGSIRSIGEALFLGHVFPLQLGALVLLVAAVGVAMLMGRRHVRGS